MLAAARHIVTPALLQLDGRFVVALFVTIETNLLRDAVPQIVL